MSYFFLNLLSSQHLWAELSFWVCMLSLQHILRGLDKRHVLAETSGEFIQSSSRKPGFYEYTCLTTFVLFVHEQEHFVHSGSQVSEVKTVRQTYEQALPAEIIVLVSAIGHPSKSHSHSSQKCFVWLLFKDNKIPSKRVTLNWYYLKSMSCFCFHTQLSILLL